MKTITELTIHDVDGKPVKIKVQRPRILALAAQGKIPNALLGVATKMISGKGIKQGDIKEMAQMIELYCRVCMVEPTYDDVRSAISDDQMFTIFSWATSDVSDLGNFRNKQEDGASDNDGEDVPKKAK